MRPTGRLHLGHLHGALRNWIRLQEQGSRCFFFVADWHVLTTKPEDTAEIGANLKPFSTAGMKLLGIVPPTTESIHTKLLSASK